MVFNSLTFLLFFAVVLLVHYSPLPHAVRKGSLLVASYLFYAAWNPPFVLLIWLSTVVDWVAVIGMTRTDSKARRRAWLLLSLVVNLGLLGFFKYASLMAETFVSLMASAGVHVELAAPDIVLPVGISFYTFQTMSYTIDVYRGRITRWPHFVDFALYVTFFPQLVAGPIVRAAEFLPQCRKLVHATWQQMSWGLHLLLFGMFQKIVLADTLLAPVADAVYAEPGAKLPTPDTADAWLGTLAFAGQIFFDFAGYSTAAIGVAMCLGFMLPRNFLFPYGAIGFSDFWRRWHISLSTWLRDYLYIPLGGNRKGRRRTYVNLMLTMLLGGLWHGASWRFVVWGALHGGYLGLERWLKPRVGRVVFSGSVGGRLVGITFTFALVCVTWVYFRAVDFDQAFTLTGAMLLGTDAKGGVVDGVDTAIVLGVVGGLVLFHGLMRSTTTEAVWGRLWAPARALLVTLMLLACALAPGDDRAFIYFQF